MRARLIGTVLAVIGSEPAFAAPEPAVKIQTMIDNGQLEPARAKCTSLGAQEATAAAALRESCAQVWLVDAERTDTIEGWAAFRAAWTDTSWAKGAFEKEADLAVSSAGYQSTEAEYQALAAKYAGSISGGLALERAAETAVANIKTKADSHAAAARYPDKIALILKKHLNDFIVATVTSDSLTWKAEPPIQAKEVAVSWVLRSPNLTTRPWHQMVEERLTGYGFGLDAIRARKATGIGPGYTVCYDPGFKGHSVGVLFVVGDAQLFIEAPWAVGCGPDVPPVLLTVAEGRVTDVSAGPVHRVGLSGRHAGYDDAGALFTRVGDPRLVKGGRIVQDAPGVAIIHPLTGGAPWLTPPEPAGGYPLPAALIAAPWLPTGYSVTPWEGGAVAYGPDKVAWLLGPGSHGAVSPLAQRYLGLDAGIAAGSVPAIPLARWSTPKGPPGSTPIPLAKGDAVALAAALKGVGLDATALGLGKASTVDLDLDGRPETVADGKASGRHAIVVWSPPDPATPEVPGRVWVWTTPNAVAHTAIAFSVDGKPAVAWSALEDEPIEVVRLEGRDLGFVVVP